METRIHAPQLLAHTAVVLRRQERLAQVRGRGIVRRQHRAQVAVADMQVIPLVQVRVRDDRVAQRGIHRVAVVPIGQRLPVDETDRGIRQQSQVEIPVRLRLQRPIPVTHAVRDLTANQLRDRRRVVLHHHVHEGQAVVVRRQDLALDLDTSTVSAHTLADDLAAGRNTARLRMLIQVGDRLLQEVRVPGIVIVVDRIVGAVRGGQARLERRLATIRHLVRDDRDLRPHGALLFLDDRAHLGLVAGVVDDDHLVVVEALRSDRREGTGEHRRAIARAHDDGDCCTHAVSSSSFGVDEAGASTWR